MILFMEYDLKLYSLFHLEKVSLPERLRWCICYKNSLLLQKRTVVLGLRLAIARENRRKTLILSCLFSFGICICMEIRSGSMLTVVSISRGIW